MNTPQEEREWLRTFPRLRQILDQPDRSGWCDSSTTFRVFETIGDDVLRVTAHVSCDAGSWDKTWDCSRFHAILRDGVFLENFVKEDERLAEALKRMPERPQRVIHIAFHGAGRGPTPDDGYTESTYVSSYRLDGEGPS